MDAHLQQINFWSHSNSRWLLKLMNYSSYKNIFNSVHLTDTELKFGAVVAESHAQHIFWALTGPAVPLFKTLARKAAGGSQVSADEFLSLLNFTALKFTNPSFYGAKINKGTEQKKVLK